MNPPLSSEISVFEPPSPSEFPVTFCGGGGVWIFSGTTQSSVQESGTSLQKPPLFILTLLSREDA